MGHARLPEGHNDAHYETADWKLEKRESTIYLEHGGRTFVTEYRWVCTCGAAGTWRRGRTLAGQWRVHMARSSAHA